MSQEKSLPSKQILIVIESLKKQIVNDRCLFIKKRLDENRQNLVGVTKSLCNLSEERNRSNTGDENSSCLLSERQTDALDIKNGCVVGCSDKDDFSPQDDPQHSPAILLGSSIAVKNAVRPMKLPEIKRLPPYTSWIFLDKNQRMADDQSVVGRRRIYYDRNGGEALICSDSEQEIVEEEDKTEFLESEDYIIRMTTKEVGTSDTVMKLLGECFSCKPCEVKARYEALVKGEDVKGIYMDGVNGDLSQPFFDKDLDAALDSFENLFCRRCLVFDCRLHGCSQDLVFPAEVQHQRDFGEDENSICGPHCYRLALQARAMRKEAPIHDDLEDKHVLSSDGVDVRYKTTRKSSMLSGRRIKSHQNQSALSSGRNAFEISDIGTKTNDTSGSFIQDKSPKTKISKKNACRRNRKRTAGNATLSMQKRHKMVTPDLGCITQVDTVPDNLEPKSDLDKEDENSTSRSQKKSSRLVGGTRIEFPSGEGHVVYEDGPIDATHALTNVGMSSNGSYKQEESNNAWRVIEKCLYRKGLEIFGYNSCLIARNLMSGMKTCMEVYHYMNCSENGQEQGGYAASSLAAGYSEVGFDENTNVLRRRSKLLRRRGRVRRLKYTWKSAGYHSVRKRISERKGEPCRQYNPCGCQSTCGKQCACLLNGTCCEKYCGCPKSCKNHFRGCHCAKSQCRSRQCPCFAADRECDPDVCRNCWVSCGDGSLGVPSQRGDNYECRNMKLFLKQQQRVLLGSSDVSGWGAFLKNNVCKHEYLGEYTGELISHREADKRGKIYDRENSSFLFNLNDQFVLDAYRKGDKLKFANHSPDPNCYAKVIMVAGDHRVGIFAKERITAGEELFYDYRYEADRAPAWARKPEASGSKKDDSAPSCGRAKKLA